MNQKLFEMANEAIKTFKHASFGVMDENGYPSISAVSLHSPEGISEIYLTTTLDSNKAKRLLKNNKAGINCFNEAANITLVGEAEIFADQETKSEYWPKWVELGTDIYPEGVSDPNYCFIRFTTKRASLWIGGEGAEFILDTSKP